MKNKLYLATHPRFLETYRMIREIRAEGDLSTPAKVFLTGVVDFMREAGLVTRKQYRCVAQRYEVLQLRRKGAWPLDEPAFAQSAGLTLVAGDE